MEIEIYTDGSCHTQSGIGAWVAIILAEKEKITLSGSEANTTNNRMELTAVLKAMEYVSMNHSSYSAIKIYSDSQYIIGLSGRKEKLLGKDFITKGGNELPNTDLIKLFFACIAKHNIEFVKIKAHQKRGEAENYNIDADLLSRKMVREIVKVNRG